MSSTTAVSSNVQVLSKTPTYSSTISTTAKSSTTTVTASAKKSRKSEQQLDSSGSTNFLPIAPHQTAFFSPNQGLTLASVQQQQLQSGGVAVFSSPTMMTTQQQGPQAGQQLVQLTAQGQPMTQTFNANGQQLIQQGMFQGLQQMQMIQTGPGQPTFTMPIHQVYSHGMQPMQLALAPNGQLMTFQQSPQQLAIQIPNGQGGSTTMITTNQLTSNTPTTPVKPAQQQGQTILKSVPISPQQPQATKSSASTTPTAVRGQQQQNQQQQTLIQQAFPSGTNQAFVIGTFQSSGPGQPNGTAILSTPTNNRKNAGAARSSSSITPKNTGANIIPKIQPATSLASSPIIAQAQFKSTSSPFQTASNATSPANGQTIMVHGQGIQSGTGGIQLAPNQTIISPFQPGITWTNLNQQQTQLVTPNGQPIFIRSPSGEQQMFIQTSNNQFQAVPMQVAAQGTQQQGSNTGTMQMTTTGPSMVASSVNQSMPIIQTNQAVPANTLVNQQQANSTAGSILTSTATSQNSSNTTTSTPTTNVSRQRAIRPAGNTLQLATSTTATAGKQKVSLDSRTPTSNIIGITANTKLAPKTGNLVATSGGMVLNSIQRTTSLAGPQAKLPVTMTKASEAGTKTPMSSTGATLVTSTTANKAAPKTTSTVTTLGTAASSSSAATTAAISANALSVSSSSTSSAVITTSAASLVNSALGTPNNRGTSPASSTLNKVASRKVDKKDSSTGTASSTLTHGLNKTTTPKSVSINGIRSSTTAASKPSTASVATNANIAPNTQMINGVLCQLPPNTQVKTSTGSGTKSSSNSTVSKSVGIGVQKGLSTPKSKPKQPESLVLTHVIDGFVIQESPEPFPVSTNSNGNESDSAKEKNALAKEQTEETKAKADLQSKGEQSLNGPSSKEASVPTANGVVTSKAESQQTPTGGVKARVNPGCVNCGKKELFKNGKDKNKKFCSAACNEAFSQKKTLQNGTAPIAVHVMPKVVAQPIMGNTIMPTIQSMPVAAMPILQPSQPLVAANLVTQQPSLPLPPPQLNGGIKRNIKETNGPMKNGPEKKARLNSPLTVAKNDSLQPSRPQQNGQPDVVESSPVKDNRAADVIPELKDIWLPPENKDPIKWTVQDVFDFIKNLEGCSGVAEEFRTHEIDGQALMFINQEHMITILHIKLGPALKICSKIKELKSAFNI